MRNRDARPHLKRTGLEAYGAVLALIAVVTACGDHHTIHLPLVPITSGTSGTLQLLSPNSASGANPAPRIMIHIRPSQDLTLGFDTGSPGLRIFAKNTTTNKSNLNFAYTDLHMPISTSFGGSQASRVYFGDLATASGITIGGPTGDAVTITAPVVFEIVTVVCSIAETGTQFGATPPPNCTNTMASEEVSWADGIFGVEPEPDQSGYLYSVMGQLPDLLSNGFIVSDYGSSPHITVGITPEVVASFTTYPVAVATSVATGAAPSGIPYWPEFNNMPGTALTEYDWCYTIGSANASPDCVAGYGTKTDSGGGSKIYLNATPPAGIPVGQLATLPPGTVVTATLGSIRWTWTTTTASGLNCNNPPFFFTAGNINLLPTQKQESNTGISPFYFNDILYDLRGGHFGMQPIPAGIAPPAACAVPSNT